jgi:hypothetical protein
MVRALRFITNHASTQVDICHTASATKLYLSVYQWRRGFDIGQPRGGWSTYKDQKQSAGAWACLEFGALDEWVFR